MEKKYSEISEALKKGKEVVDIEVENALLKSALEGNITAQIFWLKNRKPNRWREKQNLNVVADISNPFKELSIEELKKLAEDG